MIYPLNLGLLYNNTVGGVNYPINIKGKGIIPITPCIDGMYMMFNGKPEQHTLKKDVPIMTPFDSVELHVPRTLLTSGAVITTIDSNITNLFYVVDAPSHYWMGKQTGDVYRLQITMNLTTLNHYLQFHVPDSCCGVVVNSYNKATSGVYVNITFWGLHSNNDDDVKTVLNHFAAYKENWNPYISTELVPYPIIQIEKVDPLGGQGVFTFFIDFLFE